MLTHVFHKEAKSASKGVFLDNSSGQYNSLLISIKGTTTSHTVEFKFLNACGDLEPLKGLKPSDWSSGTQTSGTNESWQFEDISNMKRIYMDITAEVVGTGTGLTIMGEAR
jgi:lipoate-protein ligase B